MRAFRFAVLCGLVLSSLLAFEQAPGQSTKENADFKLAINLYNDGLFDLAVEQLKQFITTYPATSQGIEARFYLGLTQLKLQQFDDARLTFQTFALTYQDNPKAPDAWWHVGESYAALRNYREAALAYERVKVFHPRSTRAAEALVEASKYFTLAGEPANARRVLRIVLQEYPASKAVLAARAQLGQIYFKEGNLELAYGELRRVIDGDPSPDARAQALLILGNINQATGRTEQAQANYQEIIAKHRSSLAAQGAYVNLGKLLATGGKYTEAIDNFRKALDNRPGIDSSLSMEALIQTGDVYVALKDYSSAVTTYRRFLTAYPDNEHVPAILWKAALTSARARNYETSDEFCSRILASEAPAVLKRRAQVRLALNAEEQNNAARAVQVFSSILDSYADDPAAPEIIMRIAGLLEKNIRDPRKAVSYYEALETRYPRSRLADDACAAAGRCYEALKEFDRALQLYNELIDRFPASDHRPLADERVKHIGIFEARNKDAGLEKLALLVGDVVGDKDRAGMAFRLGEIYFHDLKNFSAAATQFTNAINSGAGDDRIADALFMRSQSYEYLALKEEQYRERAISSYQTFLQSHPRDPRAESAALSLFHLRAITPAAAEMAYASLVSSVPRLTRDDQMLLRIGILYEQADSTAAALSSYAGIPPARATPAAAEAGYRRIRMLAKAGLADSAVAFARSYLSAFPTGMYSASVMTLVADGNFKQGDLNNAIRLYERILQDFWYIDGAAEAEEKLADAYVATGNPARAITIYETLKQRQEANPLGDGSVKPSLLLSLGRAYHSAGNTSDAKKYLFDLLRAERSGELAGQAYSILGMIARAEGSTDIATSYFRQAATVSPATAVTRDVATMLFESGDYADAIKQFTQLAKSAKSETEKQYCESRIILAKLRSDDLAGAERDVSSFSANYRKADEDLASFELEKGLYFYRRRDFTSARKSFDRVADRYARTASGSTAMYWTGKIIEATGKPQDAIRQFDRIIKDHPGSSIIPRVHFALGNIHYNAEKWDDAIRNYRKIVDDSTADPSLLPYAMSNLIETYEAAGVFDAALSLTRRYIDLFPNNEDSFDKRIKIGILYDRLGYYDQAVAHLQDLLDEAGSDLEGEIRYYIAEANFNKGDYQQAILDFLKVPYLVTKKGKIDWTANSLYMSGQSYEKMGRYDQALTIYQQIIDRPGIDDMFKSAARKEIDRVKLVLKKNTN